MVPDRIVSPAALETPTAPHTNGHLEQCSILTPDWAQVRVGSCFRLSSRLPFSAHCFGWNTADDCPSSCRGEPFQRHQAANVVGQVLQADLGARPHYADRSHDPTARRALLRPEHMLDASAYPALGVVRSLLRQRQRVVAPTASMNPALVTAGPESGLDLGRTISAVGEHIIAGIALVQQPIQLLAVVHGRIGHSIMPDQLVL